MGTIVVGVDGSRGSEEALRFAAEEARLRGAKLRVVTAWHVPTLGYGGALGPMVDPHEYERGAEAENAQAVAALGEAAAGIEVEAVTRTGHAAQALLEEAKDADLLVVGSRGHGGFVGLLLGSVSQQCAQHAPCPVVIVTGSHAA